MDCERFDRNSMDLLYGELDELTEAATLRHMHHCTRCRDIWGHMRTTRDVAQLPQEDPPETLVAQILQAEREAHRTLPVRERFSRTISILAGYAMRPQLTMAALLVLMVGSGLIFVRTQPRGSNTDRMQVVERGVPSLEVSSPKRDDNAMVFGGDPEPFRSDADTESLDGESMQHAAARTKADPEENRARQRSTYSEAMTAYQQGRYAEAERLFSEIALAGGEQAASAALHEGHAARNGSGCQRAAKIYDTVAERQAGSTIAFEASWHAASCYRAMGQVDRAIAHYHNLANVGAFSQRAKQALAELLPPSVEPSGQEVSGDAAAMAASKAAASTPEKAPEKPAPAAASSSGSAPQNSVSPAAKTVESSP